MICYVSPFGAIKFTGYVNIFNCIYLPILNICQTATSDMINYTLNFNRALKTTLATSLQAKSWQSRPTCKHHIYRAEILRMPIPIPWSLLPHCHLLSSYSRSLNQTQQSIKETQLRIAQLPIFPLSFLPDKPTASTEWIIHTFQKTSYC
jgi:hypothetical protein